MALAVPAPIHSAIPRRDESMIASEADPRVTGATTLSDVVDRSERIQDTVEECATELSSVNEAIKRQLDRLPVVPDVAGALVRSETIEAKVQACADELTQVNEALQDEVRSREELEDELETARAHEHAARHAALHDPLTGLANRMLFDDRLEHALAQAKRHDRSMAVMFIDLDGFKGINDTHGHEAGDQVLRMVASRLTGVTRAEDTVGRRGGDEFLYLIPALKSDPDARSIARRIARNLVDAIGEPFDFQPGIAPLRIRCSVGVALYPHDARKADALVQRADHAMYRAKRDRSAVALDGDVRAANDDATRVATDPS